MSSEPGGGYNIALSLLDTELEKVNSVKCLGVVMHEYLTWDNHMLSIINYMMVDGCNPLFKHGILSN